MKRILPLVFFFMAFACTNKGGSILADATASPADTIVGKYYVADFKTDEFNLMPEMPEKKFIQQLLEFDFQPSGEIKVTDLTEIYECGNGILSLHKCEWTNRGNSTYRLRFVGEYALDSKFEFIGDYQLSVKGNDNVFTLKDTIFNKHTSIDENQALH